MLNLLKQNKTIKKQKVFVGLSGGVDSAVCAYLLQKQGYDVTGVFIMTWTPDYISCTQKEDRLDAIRVCAKLNIPFRDLDLEQEYKTKVIDYFLQEYNNNNIPNPDIMCNKYIKFDAFYKYALSHDAIIATGHYAKIKSLYDDKDKLKQDFLVEPRDHNKDQTYFLYQIKKEILQNIIFPLADLTKDQVRSIARDNNLSVADKKDSQGICMLGGDISPKEFLKKELKPKTGIVKDQDYNIIGEHDGVILYTIGERHGFRVFDNKEESAYYVVKKDFENNILIVSSTKHLKVKNQESENVIYIKDTNFFTYNIKLDEILFVQYRYRGLKIPCLFDIQNNIIILDNDVEKYKSQFVSGQSAVLYNKDNICLGGGIIC